MAVKYLTDDQADGWSVGQSVSSKISLYGKTPVIQPAATAQSAVATTAITTMATNTSVTSTVLLDSVNSLIARVAANVTLLNQIRSDLVTLGVLKGSI